MTTIHSPENRVIVIMAGGSGTRLWPLSRKASPKQFHALVSDKTLLRETYDRIGTLVPPENIFVCATTAYVDQIAENLPELPRENFILEPSARGTCSAIGFSAKTISERNPDAIIATIASDHAIDNPEEFTRALSLAFVTAEENKDKLITVGIRPTRPDTGLGYIQTGDSFGSDEAKRISFVDSFKEKPDRETAEKYIADPRYFWNSGYFIFSAPTLLSWIREFVPETANLLSEMFSEEGMGQEKIASLYAKCPSEAIDIAIVEKLSKEARLIIASELKWSDVGSFDTLYDFLSKKNESHSVFHGNVIDHASGNNLVNAPKEKLVALLGVTDLVIIDTGDALLVADRNSVGKMKDLLEKIKNGDRSDLL